MEDKAGSSGLTGIQGKKKLSLQIAGWVAGWLESGKAERLPGLL